MADIKRFRGDTVPVVLYLTDDDTDAPFVIPDGSTFTLTVSRSSAPTDGDTGVFKTGGQIVDAAGGEVRFPIITAAADILGKFYFDVEMTDPVGLVRTVDHGKYYVQQDITKAPAEQPVRIYSVEGPEGEDVPVNGDELWPIQIVSNVSKPLSITYEYDSELDAPVIQLNGAYIPITSTWLIERLAVCGKSVTPFGHRDQYLKVLGMADDNGHGSNAFGIQLAWGPNQAFGYQAMLSKQMAFAIQSLMRVEANQLDGEDWYENTYVGFDHLEWWYQVLEVRYSTNTVRTKAWYWEDPEPETWGLTHIETADPLPGDLYPLIVQNEYVNDVAAFIASIEWGLL